ncbi:hypothetical protein [Alkalinema sp. FACHB-956]|uniref:hypothetical protein n=1 Tax=Alkalinema sp. FACHB-956 TaxID=2692768 RepID=UPI0016848AB8|nr:hypothetical protein [Alkalinema sp. FACHB-956]MBD2326530.1 hypothetical protein [Alkalinema sp. FACHB-956]
MTDLLPDLFVGILNHPGWIVAIAGILHLMIGTVAAAIAVQRGKSWKQWLVIGWIGGTPALIAALRLPKLAD